MHEGIWEQRTATKVQAKLPDSHLCIPFQSGALFFSRASICGLVDEFIVPSEEFFSRVLSEIRRFMHTVRNEKYRPARCRDRETQSKCFPLQRFRDGRDYGRIKLHNMAAPNQIKVETIKARVKATAVSSSKRLPPPCLNQAKNVTLHHSTVSTPVFPSLGST